MRAADRTPRSLFACLLGGLVALLIALGPGGAAHGTASPAGHAVVAAAVGHGPQAILDLHSQPRVAEHPGNSSAPAVAPAVALPLILWRRSRRVRASAPVPGRPALGGRAPPRPSTPAEGPSQRPR